MDQLRSSDPALRAVERSVAAKVGLRGEARTRLQPWTDRPDGR